MIFIPSYGHPTLSPTLFKKYIVIPTLFSAESVVTSIGEISIIIIARLSKEGIEPSLVVV